MSGVEREALLRIFALALLDLARELNVDTVDVYADAWHGYCSVSVWEDVDDTDSMERYEWHRDDKGVL